MTSVVTTMNSKKIGLLCVCLSFSAHLFAMPDANHQQDGQYDNKPQHKTPHKRPKFSTLDLDANGVITLAEFKQHQIPRGDHLTVFNHIDVDGNGEISEEEFINHRPPRPPKGNGRDQNQSHSRPQ